MTRSLTWLLVVPLLTACAGRGHGDTPSETPGADRTASPARIYTVGEEHFAAGRYPEAITLWRAAIMELPQDPAHDELRHKLILRLAYGQLMAWDQSGNVGYLEDAQQMLERYAARHQGLFGDGEDANTQRGEIYELLHEVDRRLDPTDDEDATDEAPQDHDPLRAMMDTAVALANEAEDLTETNDEAAAEATSEDYVEDGEFHRTVVVGRARPSADDPNIRAMFDSLFTDPFHLGGVLTAPGPALIHGPRPLLRAGGIARPVEAAEPLPRGAQKQARALGRSLLAEARPALKSCYEAAYARRPIDTARSTVQVQLDAQGQVQDAKIVEGGLVDTLGDLCLVRELESMKVDKTVAAGGATIEVPMTFFYQGPVFINEGTGRSAPAGVYHQVDAVPGDPSKRPRGRSAVGTTGAA